jgi:hypothetical protein
MERCVRGRMSVLICSFWCNFRERPAKLIDRWSFTYMYCVNFLLAFVLVESTIHVFLPSQRMVTLLPIMCLTWGDKNVLALVLAHMAGLIDARICACLHPDLDPCTH